MMMVLLLLLWSCHNRVTFVFDLENGLCRWIDINILVGCLLCLKATYVPWSSPQVHDESSTPSIYGTRTHTHVWAHSLPHSHYLSLLQVIVVHQNTHTNTFSLRHTQTPAHEHCSVQNPFTVRTCWANSIRTHSRECILISFFCFCFSIRFLSGKINVLIFYEAVKNASKLLQSRDSSQGKQMPENESNCYDPKKCSAI